MYQSFLRRKGGAGFLGRRPCGTHRPSRAPPQPFGLLGTMSQLWLIVVHNTEPRPPEANCFVQHCPMGWGRGERGAACSGRHLVASKAQSRRYRARPLGGGRYLPPTRSQAPIPLPCLRRKDPCSPISPAYKRGQKIPQNLQNEARHPCIRWAILQSRQRTIYWRLHMKGE